MCVYIYASLCCTPGTNNILNQLYFNKNKIVLSEKRQNKEAVLYDSTYIKFLKVQINLYIGRKLISGCLVIGQEGEITKGHKETFEDD